MASLFFTLWLTWAKYRPVNSRMACYARWRPRRRWWRGWRRSGWRTTWPAWEWRLGVSLSSGTPILPLIQVWSLQNISFLNICFSLLGATWRKSPSWQSRCSWENKRSKENPAAANGGSYLWFVNIVVLLYTFGLSTLYCFSPSERNTWARRVSFASLGLFYHLRTFL